MSESMEVWRLKAGFKTPTQLAAKVGVSAETVRRWERGINQPCALAAEALEKLGWKGEVLNAATSPKP